MTSDHGKIDGVMIVTTWLKRADRIVESVVMSDLWQFE